MYCINCGVHLADTENKCPLCNTVVYHPQITQKEERPLYPIGKMPRSGSGRRFLCGAIIIMFMIPVVLTFFSDLQINGKLDWFGYVAGGIAITYLTFAFPMWFKKPNPVVFAPCDFASYAIYLFFINLASGGDWFFTFALPIIGGIAIITFSLITLLKYLRRGRLYVIGGSVMGLSALIFMIEWLMITTFDIRFIGWSLYPSASLFLIGALMIYLAINPTAREKFERKLFF